MNYHIKCFIYRQFKCWNECKSRFNILLDSFAFSSQRPIAMKKIQIPKLELKFAILPQNTGTITLNNNYLGLASQQQSLAP